MGLLAGFHRANGMGKLRVFPKDRRDAGFATFEVESDEGNFSVYTTPENYETVAKALIRLADEFYVAHANYKASYLNGLCEVTTELLESAEGPQEAA